MAIFIGRGGLDPHKYSQLSSPRELVSGYSSLTVGGPRTQKVDRLYMSAIGELLNTGGSCHCLLIIELCNLFISVYYTNFYELHPTMPALDPLVHLPN